MVVVPALSERQERNDEVVSAVVRCRKRPCAIKVADRADTEGKMINAYRADRAAPNHELGAAHACSRVEASPYLTEQIQQECVAKGNQVAVSLEQLELRQPAEFPNKVLADRDNARRKEPTHVTPEYTRTR